MKYQKIIVCSETLSFLCKKIRFFSAKAFEIQNYGRDMQTHFQHFLYLLMFLFLSTSSMGMEITEVLYDPMGSDNNKEFVEVHASNLSGWTIFDNASSDILVPLLEVNSPFSLIVEEDFNYSQLNCSIYSIGSAIGNGLSVGEVLVLSNSSEKLNFTIWEAREEGFAITHLGKGQISGGTPCLPEPPQAEQPQEQETENHPTLCNSTFSINTEKIVYQPGESVKLFLHASQQIHPTIEYWIEDLAGNILKQPRTTASLDEKSWTIPAKIHSEALLFRAIADASCLEDPLEREQLFGIKLPSQKRIPILEIINIDKDAQTFSLELNAMTPEPEKMVLKVKKGNKVQHRREFLIEGTIEGEFYMPYFCDGEGIVEVELGNLQQQEEISFPLCSESVKETSEDKDDKKGSGITSLYTRMEPKESMTFYSRIEADTLRRTSRVASLWIKAAEKKVRESETLQWQVNLSEGMQEIMIILQNDSSILDFERTNITLPQQKEKNNLSTITRISKNANATKNTTKKLSPTYGSQGSQNTKNIKNNASLLPISGKTVLLSEREKKQLQKNGLWLIIAAFVLLIGGVLYRRHTGQANKIHKAKVQIAENDPALLQNPSRR